MSRLTRGCVEFVSSLDQDLETITCYCRSLEGYKFYVSSSLLFCGRMNSQAFAIPEIDHLLERVCQTFEVPVAQYWIYSDLSETFRVVHQFSSREFENLASWWEFKDVCLHMPLKKYEGLVGTRYFSHESCFFRDITELSIDDYPFKHYAQKCGSIASFTIRLHSPYPPSKAYVLEFLFPSQGNDSYHPQTLLNSLLVEMKEHLPNFMLTSGEQLVHVSSVKVINISTLENPKSFDIGQPDSSLPRHEGLLYTHTMKLFKDGTEQSSNLTSYEEAATGETSKRTPSEVPEIVHLDESEQESDILCTEHRSFSSQHKKLKNILEHNWNAAEMDLSAMEMTLEEASKLKKHAMKADRVNEQVEESPMSNKHIGRAMTTASQPTMKLLAQHQKEFIVPDDNSKKKFILLEDDTTIHVENKTSMEAHTSESERKSEKTINFESLSKHFGRPLDDAAASFGVSRSTFKRLCRDYGIKRWQNRKRRMDGDVSSKLTTKLKNEEPSIRNFSYSGTTPVQDTIVARTGQELNEMTVKVTYNGISIRFKLPGSSGMAELENNVIERLHLERKSFSIKYQDDEEDWVLIACDRDVWECMQLARSLKKSTIKLLLDLPIHHHAP